MLWGVAEDSGRVDNSRYGVHGIKISPCLFIRRSGCIGSLVYFSVSFRCVVAERENCGPALSQSFMAAMVGGVLHS